MRRFLVLLLALVAFSPCYGENLIVNDHEPIIIKLDTPEPTKEQTVTMDWYSPNSKVYWREAAAKNTIHVWAPVGTFELQGMVYRHDWEKRTFTIERVYWTITVNGTSPGPNPPDPPNPPVPSGNFAAQVKAAYDALPDATRKAIVQYTQGDGNKTEKLARLIIADNYAGVAKAASVPNVYDPSAMIAEIKTRHASTLPVQTLREWRPFFDGLAKAFVDAKIPADDTATHVKRFQDIADVLTRG